MKIVKQSKQKEIKIDSKVSKFFKQKKRESYTLTGV